MLSVVDDSDPLVGELSQVPSAPAGLLETLGRVPDPHGVRHQLPVVLGVALAAVLAEAKSFTGIGEWAADVPIHEQLRLGVDGLVPSESTIQRCLRQLAPDSFDALVRAWTFSSAAQLDAAGKLTHLLDGLCQRTGAVIRQLAVGAKTNEIPRLPKLLAVIDIRGAVVTAGALHCQCDTAEHITSRGGHYVFTVKDNQPKLREQLKTLPWKQVPIQGASTGRGHGRTEKRVLKATEVQGGVLFPNAVQVLQLTRVTRRRKTGRGHTEVVYAVTDAKPSQVATWLRGHWHIENRFHWVRDVAYAEDHRQIRTRGGPQIMATLRNTAISLLRLNGHTNITAALRHCARDPQRPINLLLNS